MRIKVATPTRIERRGSDDTAWPNNTAFIGLALDEFRPPHKPRRVSLKSANLQWDFALGAPGEESDERKLPPQADHDLRKRLCEPQQIDSAVGDRARFALTAPHMRKPH
jgi:hypothetical protein